jgi:hypothetical protein
MTSREISRLCRMMEVYVILYCIITSLTQSWQRPLLDWTMYAFLMHTN